LKNSIYDIGELVWCQLYSDGILEWYSGIVFEKNEAIWLPGGKVHYNIYYDSKRYWIPVCNLKKIDLK